MFRSKKEIFDSTKSRWPSKFQIIYDASNHRKFETKPSDLDVYKSVEMKIAEDDEWSHVAAWSFHQALGVLIGWKFEQNDSMVYIKDVSFDLFDDMMRSNLSHESWREEREIYNSLPITVTVH